MLFRRVFDDVTSFVLRTLALLKTLWTYRHDFVGTEESINEYNKMHTTSEKEVRRSVREEEIVAQRFSIAKNRLL